MFNFSDWLVEMTISESVMSSLFNQQKIKTKKMKSKCETCCALTKNKETGQWECSRHIQETKPAHCNCYWYISLKSKVQTKES